jgi:HPt (histidine-containing phosphotransfer) domain-containing protein
MSQLSGDRSILIEVVRLLIETVPDQMKAIEAAVDAGDPIRLAATAHALRGAISNVTTLGSVESCRRLEDGARAGGVAGADAELTVLKAEVDRLLTDLRAFS